MIAVLFGDPILLLRTAPAHCPANQARSILSFPDSEDPQSRAQWENNLPGQGSKDRRMVSRVSRSRTGAVGGPTDSGGFETNSKDRSEPTAPAPNSKSEIYPNSSAALAAEEDGPETETRRSPGRVICSSTPASWLERGMLMQVGSKQLSPRSKEGRRGPGKIQIRPSRKSKEPTQSPETTEDPGQPANQHAAQQQPPRRLSAVTRTGKSPKVTPRPLYKKAKDSLRVHQGLSSKPQVEFLKSIIIYKVHYNSLIFYKEREREQKKVRGMMFSTLTCDNLLGFQESKDAQTLSFAKNRSWPAGKACQSPCAGAHIDLRSIGFDNVDDLLNKGWPGG